MREEAERLTGVDFHRLMSSYLPPKPEVVDDSLEEDAWDLRNVFQTLLSGPPYTDQPFTIAEIADHAGVSLEAATGDAVWRNGAVQQLLNEAARRNIMVGSTDWDGVPSILTVYDPELHWVRIPRSIAKLAHLRAHALIRRQQLQQMEARSRELDRVLEKLSARLSDDEDDTTALDVLLNREEPMFAHRTRRKAA